ncbi:MAG TPA: tRNA (adenosine(37)-N6)-dimethylallyltransferase MiaA [bacterium]
MKKGIKNHPVIIIGGPTGSGKTGLALFLATNLNGEIINADSRQIYRFMDIGTAKPTPEQLSTVKHHLIDMVDPDQDFNAQLFIKFAEKAFRDIINKGMRVFVAGGTGLYISAFLNGMVEGAPPNNRVRSRLRTALKKSGEKHMYDLLKKIDPESARLIHPNDSYRVLRALEIYETTGVSPSKLRKEKWKSQSVKNNVLYLCIDMPRKKLYDNINKRADMLIKKGLVDEVKYLLSNGYGEELKSMQSFGYREIVRYVKGESSLADAIEELKKNTRHYAKRQVTWFRGVKGVRWVNPDSEQGILQTCRDFLEEVDCDKSAA